MKLPFCKTLTALSMIGAVSAVSAQELVSVRLTDVIKSQGTGNIDLMKDVTAVGLEQYRVQHDGALVFAVDINEDASGTEKASSQGVAVKSVRFTADFDDGSQLVLDSIDGCCFTETQALLAEAPGDVREPFYTLLGESGSSRISSSNSIQDAFDSTLKVEVSEPLYDPSGRTVVGARLQVVLLQTNDALGDPEAFYDFSAGFEDLAILNVADTVFIDDYAAGREEAPTVILTNPPPVVDTVAYQLQYGLNTDGEIVVIQGVAYLITRGSSYSHDWHLSIDMPGGASGAVTCTNIPDYRNSEVVISCPGVASNHSGGTMDIRVFNDTLALFPDPAGSVFVNTQRLYSEPWNLKFFPGPRADFRLELDTPQPQSAIQPAPYDPYLYVRNTGRIVKLMEVDPTYQDSNGFPFGMLLTVDWKPPLEFTDTAVAYPFFEDFVGSSGGSSLDWYNTSLTDFIVEIPGPTVWAW
jgi:hypothetical protein